MAFARLALAVVALSLFAAPAARAEGGPLQVKVGLLLLSLGKLDVASGTYTVDFYLSLRSDRDMGDVAVEFMNGRATHVDKFLDTPTDKQFRYQANLMTNIDVRRFPWDAHALPIIIETTNRKDDDIVFVRDDERSGIDASVLVVGWRLADFTTQVTSHVYPQYANDRYSQIAFRVHIERLMLISSLKTFLPMICFLLIAFISLIVTVEKLESRVGMNTAMLIASVMFHLSITNQLPPAAYLTIADKALIASYLVIGFNLLLSVLMMRLMQVDRVDDAKRLRTRSFVWLPTFTLVAYAIVAVS